MVFPIIGWTSAAEKAVLIVVVAIIALVVAVVAAGTPAVMAFAISIDVVVGSIIVNS